MGAVDPQGNLRQLNWNNPNEGLRDDEIGLNREQYGSMTQMTKKERSKSYAAMRKAGKMPPSVLPKSLRK